MKRSILLIILFFVFASAVFAKRLPPPEVSPLTKGEFTYSASYSYTGDWKDGYDFGMIIIESTGVTKYYYAVPIYSVKLNKNLEYDVQWQFIKSMEFKNDEIITITNEKEQVFEFNIKTYEVKCVSHKYDSNVNELYEKKINIRELINKNQKYKYKGTQPSQRKLSKIEDVITVAENVLFPIYGEEEIKNEMPYNIYKFGNKWFVCGSLPKGWVGGVFEIVIDAETSQIESVIHEE